MLKINGNREIDVLILTLCERVRMYVSSTPFQTTWEKLPGLKKLVKKSFSLFMQGQIFNILNKEQKSTQTCPWNLGLRCNFLLSTEKLWLNLIQIRFSSLTHNTFVLLVQVYVTINSILQIFTTLCVAAACDSVVTKVN